MSKYSNFREFVLANRQEPLSYEQLMKAVLRLSHNTDIAQAVLTQVISMPGVLNQMAHQAVGELTDFYYILNQPNPGIVTLACRPSFDKLPNNSLYLATVVLSLTAEGRIRWMGNVTYTAHLVSEQPLPPAWQPAAPSGARLVDNRSGMGPVVKIDKPQAKKGRGLTSAILHIDDAAFGDAVNTTGPDLGDLVAAKVKEPKKPAEAKRPSMKQAVDKGFAVWFQPKSEGGIQVVYCEHHREQGIVPDAEEFLWGRNVTAEQWKLVLSLGYKPLGSLHPREKAKLAQLERKEEPTSTMDFGNAMHLNPEDIVTEDVGQASVEEVAPNYVIGVDPAVEAAVAGIAVTVIGEDGVVVDPAFIEKVSFKTFETRAAEFRQPGYLRPPVR